MMWDFGQDTQPRSRDLSRSRSPQPPMRMPSPGFPIAQPQASPSYNPPPSPYGYAAPLSSSYPPAHSSLHPPAQYTVTHSYDYPRAVPFPPLPSSNANNANTTTVQTQHVLHVIHHSSHHHHKSKHRHRKHSSSPGKGQGQVQMQMPIPSPITPSTSYGSGPGPQPSPHVHFTPTAAGPLPRPPAQQSHSYPQPPRPSNSQAMVLHKPRPSKHHHSNISPAVPHMATPMLPPSSANPAFQPLNPQFQYSRCTGRKRALCIGINYHGQANELRGCVNDAKHVRDFLIKQGKYHASDILLLTDDPKGDSRNRPTRSNIIQAMRWLVHGAQRDDSLFFHYSGHGGQVPDEDGDEVDGWDEVIFPVDFRKNGHIVDDEMHEIMVKALPVGCRLTGLFDSCHSGTVLDLPYIYSSHGRLKGSHVSNRARRQKATPADVISWSGCKDGQTSADTFAGGVAVGAMSSAFITALTDRPALTYQELLSSVRRILSPRYSQKPQLGSSHRIDTNLRFIF